MVLVRRDTSDDGASVTDYTGDILLFPAVTFSQLLKRAVPSGDRVKAYITRSAEDHNRWCWCRKWRKGMVLNEDSAIDVSHHRQAFSIIDELALRHRYVSR